MDVALRSRTRPWTWRHNWTSSSDPRKQASCEMLKLKPSTITFSRAYPTQGLPGASECPSAWLFTSACRDAKPRAHANAVSQHTARTTRNPSNPIPLRPHTHRLDWEYQFSVSDSPIHATTRCAGQPPLANCGMKSCPSRHNAAILDLGVCRFASAGGGIGSRCVVIVRHRVPGERRAVVVH